MSYTENLTPEDPRQEIYALQQRIIRGEEPTDEELEHGLRLLRETRGVRQSASVEAGKPAGSRGKAPAQDVDLDSLLNLGGKK